MSIFSVISSLFVCVLVYSNLVLLCDTFDALNAPLTSELANSVASMQWIEGRDCSYRKLWMSVEQSTDPAFPLRDVQSSDVKSLLASILSCRSDYRNGTNIAAWCTECSSIHTRIEDGVAEQGG